MPSLPSSGCLMILPLGNFCWCSETVTSFSFNSIGKSVKRAALLKQAIGEYFVEAVEDTWICSINRADFQNLLQKTPDLSLKLLNNFGEKLVAIEHNSVLRNTLDAKERILAYLNDLANEQGKNEVKLELKKKDLASYLGITPETFSRKLKELEKDGKIEVHGRWIKMER